ncbi:MAG: hypothetical protein H6553_12380 [Chitinophagales bacterium]|nr:hypothetical protein [Chitinophagales bacterium]
MKNICIFILYVIFSFNVGYAQNGYSIKVKTIPAADTTMVLSYYVGTNAKFFTVDTLKITNGIGEITQSQNIKGAIYRVAFNNADKKEYINLAIDNGAIVDLEIPLNDIKNSISKNSINSNFIKYQNNTLVKQDRITMLNNFISEYPQSILAIFSKVELLAFNEVPKQDSAIIEFQNKYFNSIDVLDKRIQLLPNIYNKLYDFVSLRPINVKNYIKAEDILLTKLNCNDANFSFYIDWLVKNIYYYNEKYKLTDAYNYLVNEYLVKNYCFQTQKELYKKVTDYRDKIQENQVGTILPNFNLKIFDTQNETTFYDLIQLKKYTFVIFYDPECSHCKEKVPVVANNLKSILASYSNLQVITVVNAIRTKETIQSFIGKAQLQSFTNCEVNGDIEEFRNHINIHSNPNFYLINQEGEILVKDNNINEIIKSISY